MGSEIVSWSEFAAGRSETKGQSGGLTWRRAGDRVHAVPDPGPGGWPLLGGGAVLVRARQALRLVRVRTPQPPGVESLPAGAAPVEARVDVVEVPIDGWGLYVDRVDSGLHVADYDVRATIARCAELGVVPPGHGAISLHGYALSSPLHLAGQGRAVWAGAVAAAAMWRDCLLHVAAGSPEEVVARLSTWSHADGTAVVAHGRAAVAVEVARERAAQAEREVAHAQDAAREARQAVAKVGQVEGQVKAEGVDDV